MGKKRYSRNIPHMMLSNKSDELVETSNPQHDMQHSGTSPLKRQNFSVDRMKRPGEKSPAKKDHGSQKKAITKKKTKFFFTNVRRSERIKSAVVSSPKNNCGFEVIEDITVSDSEKDEAETEMEQELALDLPQEQEQESEPKLRESFGDKGLDEKVDSALNRIDALDKIVEWLKSQVDEFPSKAAGYSYKSLYIDSQKQIEALKKENQRLNGKLENALGKIEVYEKEIRALIDLLDKTKDSVKDAMISNLAKSVEAAVKVSTQAINNARSAPPLKRKKKSAL